MDAGGGVAVASGGLKLKVGVEATGVADVSVGLKLNAGVLAAVAAGELAVKANVGVACGAEPKPKEGFAGVSVGDDPA